MSSSGFLLVILYLFAFLNGAGAVAPERTLTAAHKKAALRRRGLNCDPSLASTDLVFVDENSLHDVSPFGARVSFTPKLPTVFLDDVGHIVSDISCGDANMFIRFYTPELKEEAKASWMQHSSFLVVTSVSECADSGAHQMFRVSSISEASSEPELILSVEATVIKENVRKYQVQFGSHIYDGLIKDEVPLNRRIVEDADLAKRDDDITAAATRPSFPTLPANTPASAPTKVSQNIQFSYKRTKIIPPSDEIAGHVSGLFVPEHVELTCIDCTSEGRITLVNGDFGVDFDTETNLQGYVNVIAQGVRSHIEMGLKLEKGFTASFVAGLPPIPIPFLSIVGVGGIIGATFVPEIPMGVQLDSEIEFFSGFELEIPDNSEIHIDIGNPGKSYDRGFTRAKLSALPFNMHSTPPKLTFFAGLQPHIQLGAILGNETADANVGIYLDSPRMQVAIGEVNGTNEKCERTSSNPVDHSLIHVVPKAVVDVVAYAEANVEHFGTQVATVIAKTAFPLPTACLDFDNDTQELVPAGGHKSGAVLQALGGYKGCQELLLGSLLVSITALVLSWM